ncbi:hypothetical protein sscle_07g057400 [Sclerotinia sclerotiorum 1980 UF-70]|uniref:Uncharacterized protein n=2 Tax=Sclerotinia sclerotiorum (strain ATCC 18683 / 1980 / Ss-1) TaxID=665079 RepID=A0A1D9Q7M7_SCLS1|nr:hypothetical protein sscle_07g057400 [Sclerotinia sclerotiorum 1980 UF-70]
MLPVRSKKYKERVELTLIIESEGECARRGQRCDISGPSSRDMTSIIQEQERLDREREETLSKLLRLDKQQRFLRGRASEMIRRGLKTMDELDDAEEKERLDKERIGKEQSNSGLSMLAEASSNVLDNSDPSSFLSPSDPFSFQNSSGPFWGDPDSVGEMPPTSQGS